MEPWVYYTLKFLLSVIFIVPSIAFYKLSFGCLTKKPKCWPEVFWSVGASSLATGLFLLVFWIWYTGNPEIGMSKPGYVFHIQQCTDKYSVKLIDKIKTSEDFVCDQYGAESKELGLFFRRTSWVDYFEYGPSKRNYTGKELDGNICKYQALKEIDKKCASTAHTIF